MTAKDTRDLGQLRKDIDAAVARMVEMRDEFAAKREAEKTREMKEWFDGHATGVDHALYALWIFTGGAHGVDTRKEAAIAAEAAPVGLTPELLAEVAYWSKTPFAHDQPPAATS